MISFLPLLLGKFPKIPWRLIGAIGIAVALLIVAWRIHHHGYKAGVAEITVKWQADTAARDKADADAREADRKRQVAAQDHNDQVEKQHADDLAAISADRDGLVRLLRQADDQVRTLTAGKATDQLGIAVARQIASRAEETYRLLGNYDAACRADASQLDSLIAEIKPQL